MVARRSRASAGTRTRKASSSGDGGRFDYGDIEYRESDVYDGPEPTKGLLRMQLVHAAEYTKQGEEEPSSIQWVFKALDGEENKHGESVAGWKGRKYTTEKAKFIEQNILVATGVMEAGGSAPVKNGMLDFDAIVRKAKPCRVLITMGRYIPDDPEQEAEYRAELSSSFLPDDGGTGTKAKASGRRAASRDDDDDEDEPPARTSRRGRKAEPEPEPEDEDEGDEDGDEREEASEEDLETFGDELGELKLAELKEVAERYEVELKPRMKADAIIDLILDAAEEDGMFVDDFPEEEGEGDDEPEEEPEPPKGRRAGRSATSARSSGSASKARTGKRGFDDEPPF